MITIGFSTRNDNQEYVEYLRKTSGIKDVEIIQKINNGEKSLSKVYNEIIEESTNDIIVLCHDDILYEKKYWGKKILEHFNKHPEYGILGVAGTRFLSKTGCWWENQSEMIGQVYHQQNGKKWLSSYNEPFGNKIIDTVLVDGLFLSINKKNIQSKFNESFDGFHFYDVAFCYDNFIKDVKIGTISNLPITHLSVGQTNNKWEENRIKFSEINKENLPILIGNEYPKLNIDEKKPIVSIIMPIYNYGNMFEKSIESVFSSTYKNIELIIINDGSTSEYVKMKLKTLENHPNIKIINQENFGPSNARNNGIKISIGKYILPLDSDDLIHPTYIQRCLSIIEKDSKISPVYCDTMHIGQQNYMEIRPEWSMNRLIHGPFIVNCSMFSRESFDVCGGYDESLKGWEDYDLWIRMGINNYIGKRIPNALFLYFHHENDGTVSTEANKNSQELYKRIMEKNFKQ